MASTWLLAAGSSRLTSPCSQECSGPRQRSGSRVAPFAPEICYVGLRDDNGSGRINKAHRIEDAKKQEASGKILCSNRIDWKEMCCWQKEGVKVGLLGS
jgi:hypothetical protein